MTIQEKMHSGALYLPMDEALFQEQLDWLDRLWDFNATRPSQLAERETLLRELFAEIGEGCYIEPPLHANWGGRHVHFGRNIYANFNLTLVDDTHIYVGDNTMFGPNVVVATAGHPFCRSCGSRASSTTRRSISAGTAGSARGPSSCPGSRWGTTRSLARGALSPRTFPPACWPWGTPAGCCGRSGSMTGPTTSRTGGSTAAPYKRSAVTSHSLKETPYSRQTAGCTGFCVFACCFLRAQGKSMSPARERPLSAAATREYPCPAPARARAAGDPPGPAEARARRRRPAWGAARVCPRPPRWAG